ncbi:MAG: ribosome silencing factor [Acholeplasmatales bacterium]|jgi:ribosome-associated protein|nr:ribosome silencing factor [Acholeplasmatales bacterium]
MIDLIKKIVEKLKDVKASDIQIYNLGNKSPFYEYVIICSASSRQSSGAIGKIKDIEELQIKNIEGKGGAWVLIDCHNIIIHIFSEENRKYYALDMMLLGFDRIEI